MTTFSAMQPVNGQVPTVLSNIYQCPSGSTYVKQVMFFSEDTAEQVIDVYVIPNGGVATRVRRFVLDQNQSAELIKGGGSIVLTQGDAIQAVALNGGVVDFTVTGVTET